MLLLLSSFTLCDEGLARFPKFQEEGIIHPYSPQYVHDFESWCFIVLYSDGTRLLCRVAESSPYPGALGRKDIFWGDTGAKLPTIIATNPFQFHSLDSAHYSYGYCHIFGTSALPGIQDSAQYNNVLGTVKCLEFEIS